MRRRRFLSGVLTGSAGGLAGCQWTRGESRTPTGSAPPRLSVDGRWLTDPDGNRVVLRGVNVVDPWWGTTYADLRGKDYWETLRLATDADEGWHATALRVPIEPRSVREVGLDTLLSNYVDSAVELAREQDVYVVLDYHAIERYDTEDIDRRIRRFWRAVAPRYAGESHVLYELFNEPTEPRGDGLESWRTWRDYAQPWVDLVREHAPDTPIVVGSPRWSSLARYAPQAPFDGDPIVYSAHVFPSWSRDSWERTFGVAAVAVPVFVTEWGYIGVETERTEPHMIGSTDGWGEPFRQWVDAHANVSWCAWAFDSHWQPRMFDHDWNLLGGNDYMGEFTRDWLADRRNDHRPGSDETATNEPPTPPSDLRVLDRRTTRVRIAWDPATDPDGGSVVQYRVTRGDADPIVLDGSATSATITGLEPERTYEVSVVAVDGYGGRSGAATLAATTRSPAEPVATIPRTDAAPTVDATVDDAWAASEVRPLENVLVGTLADVDLAAEWRALWDADALYYLVSVTDSDVHVDSTQIWNDDAVEIYLDPDHSREASYDGENDAQLVVVRGADRVRPGANSVDWSDGVELAQTETDAGWRVEVAVPWDLAGVSPEPGHHLGTDVHAIDDEDGGERDAKLAWYATSDDSWQNPRTFATVALGE